MESYSWKSGVQFPVKAQVAADTIKKLQAAIGRDDITAKELLDASRDENAPLHSCFEWDDSIAAEHFRVYQARKLIGSIEIVIQRDESETISTRAFVNVKPQTPTQQGQFVGITFAMENPDYRQQVLKNALNELESFQRKYSVYSELTTVFKAINDFADSLK